MTSFLRGAGITTQALRDRRRRINEDPNLNEEPAPRRRGSEPIVTLSDESDAPAGPQDEEMGEEEELRQVARQKRARRDASGGSDDENDDDELNGDLQDGGSKVPRITGRRDTCALCQNKFTINVYTIQDDEGNNLCKRCGDMIIQQRKAKVRNQGNQGAAKKRRKKVAEALLDRSLTDTMVKKLQDVCLATISNYIDDVESFGYIGTDNMNKIARILSRNRRINAKTTKLFLDPAVKKLELWDCSELPSETYELIPAYCPNLETLTLSMCGQIEGGNLILMAEKLEKLEHLYLDGPFLVRADDWLTVLDLLGPRLKSLTIKNTHRVDDTVLAHMVESCPNLERLSLIALSGVAESTPIHLLTQLSNLKSLELNQFGFFSEMHQSDPIVTDDAVLDILSILGPQLETLKLDACSEITDKVLEGIKTNCKNLQVLSLNEADRLTDGAFANLFSNWETNAGLVSVSVERCLKLGDQAVSNMIDHCHGTIVDLNVNSLRDLSKDPLYKLKEAPHLTSLNIGFLRSVDDDLVEKLVDSCRHLTLIEAWGSPKITESCKLSRPVRLIGRQAEII